MRKASALCLFLGFLNACTSTESVVERAAPAEVEEERASPDQINEMIERVELQSPANISPRARAQQTDEITETIAHIPVEINGAVKQWIDYFTVKDRERFARFLERGEKYRPMITEVLRDEELPEDLYYLAMIESGFATAATSHASAVGVWQFISATGRRYGLRVDSFVDERRDPMRATAAATLYLKDLHNVFQSWYLAMAAYNAGESRIMNAIMVGKSRNFWDLVKKKVLPSETMNYIPKFLAAVIIGHDPERYGFAPLKKEPHPELVLVKIPSPVRLSDVARITGISDEHLRRFNPNLYRGITPANSERYGIWVPRGQEKLLAEHRERLAKATFTPAPAVSKPSRFHKVRKGETVASISRKYAIPADSIRKLNNLRSNHLAVGRRLRLPSAALTESNRNSSAPQSYRVRHGDNLHTISRKFNISINELKEANKLKRNTIYVGQVLRIADRG